MTSPDTAASPPRAWSPWQRLYGAALAARRRRLTAAAARLPLPVLSIGNLHWGGGGKTPLVIAVARQLASAGRRVAVLSRGYGRSSHGVAIVSRGAGPELPVEVAGDEPFLIASEAAGVAVVVGERRIDAGRHALAELRPSPDLFLLDDGFSHAGLARDLDLLVFPAADPLGGGRLLPSGRLREPLAAVCHADAVLLTGVLVEPTGEVARLATALAPHGLRGPAFAAPTRVGRPVTAGGEELPAGTPVFAVAAIARPAGFFAAARAAGLAVAGEFALRDHDPFAPRTLARIEQRAVDAGAACLLVTAKDRAKLAGRTALPLAVLPILAEPQPEFWGWLDARLGEFGR